MTQVLMCVKRKTEVSPLADGLHSPGALGPVAFLCWERHTCVGHLAYPCGRPQSETSILCSRGDLLVSIFQ